MKWTLYNRCKVILSMVICLFVATVVCGSCGYPRIYVGDSSGYASYDRNTRKLEIIWERHTHIEDCRQDNDTITHELYK